MVAEETKMVWRWQFPEKDFSRDIQDDIDKSILKFLILSSLAYGDVLTSLDTKLEQLLVKTANKKECEGELSSSWISKMTTSMKNSLKCSRV